MTIWEYEVVQMGMRDNPSGVESRLKAMGRSGWELVHVNPDCTIYFLKRPKQPKILDVIPVEPVCTR